MVSLVISPRIKKTKNNLNSLQILPENKREDIPLTL